MDFTNLRELAAGNSWGSIWPELSLGCLALFLLVLETMLPKAQHARIQMVSILGQLAILAVLLSNFSVPYRGAFNGLLMLSPAGQLMRVFFLLSSILVSILARASLAKQRVAKVEFHHIVLIVTAAMMLLVQSRNFVMLFVALETVTVGLYILVSYYRSSAKTLGGGPQVPGHGRAEFGSPPLRDRAPLWRRRQPLARRPHGQGDAVPRAARLPRGEPGQLPRGGGNRARAVRRRLQGRRLPVPDLDSRRVPGGADARDRLPRRGVQGGRLHCPRGTRDGGFPPL